MFDLKELVLDSIEGMLSKTISPKKISEIKAKHNNKVHFIPYNYRVLGGILQSLNIQFGNFIEVLIHKIIRQESNIEILKESGSKFVTLSINSNTDRIIDEYITKCQQDYDAKLSEARFNKIISDIFESEKFKPDMSNIIKHDVDMLFKYKDVIYYLEFKYTDDHDTGKVIDINRKFLKTYAGLINYLNIDNISHLYPYIYYFNNITKRPNQFIYEGSNILRGAKFFDLFLSITYEELDNILKEISSDDKVIELFDNLYKGIRYE